MGLIKRKPEPTPEPTPDLVGQILRMRGELESFIDGQVDRLKQTADGRSLPREVLRQSLTRNNSCLCAVAMNILADQ